MQAMATVGEMALLGTMGEMVAVPVGVRAATALSSVVLEVLVVITMAILPVMAAVVVGLEASPSNHLPANVMQHAT